MEYNECVVVNIIGGPGTGKSILASEVFAKVKREGITCDVSWEYIKRKLREKALKVVQSQIYIFGKQQFQLFTMKDEVKVVITDAPFILGPYYDTSKCPYLKALVLHEYNKYNNLLYLIERDLTVPYETEGRYQDSVGAKLVDIGLKTFLDDNNIPYKVLKGIGPDSLETILQDIKKEINVTNILTFEESSSYQYTDRTITNASADATIAIAIDFTTAGEILTKNAVLAQNKKYIPIDANQLIVTEERVTKIADTLKAVNAKSLNIAGNGLYTMKGKYTQYQVDEFTYKLLQQVNEIYPIESIRTGGQTGFDEAGAKAGVKLGIPTLVLAPKGWRFRPLVGGDISNEGQFKQRFI